MFFRDHTETEAESVTTNQPEHCHLPWQRAGRAGVGIGVLPWPLNPPVSTSTHDFLISTVYTAPPNFREPGSMQPPGVQKQSQKFQGIAVTMTTIILQKICKLRRRKSPFTTLSFWYNLNHHFIHFSFVYFLNITHTFFFLLHCEVCNSHIT